MAIGSRLGGDRSSRPKVIEGNFLLQSRFDIGAADITNNAVCRVREESIVSISQYGLTNT